MSVRRAAIQIGLAVFVAGCVDQPGPRLTGVDQPLSPTLSTTLLSDSALHVLRQAATAPPLETYQVSFWARRDKPATVRVNYQPTAGQKKGAPFLQFTIPKDGLVATAYGAPLRKSDSVLIRLNIDTLTFTATFEPSGLIFREKAPATLTLWYANADPDLDGNGVVDDTDAQLEQQIAIWYQRDKKHKIKKKAHQLASTNDLQHQIVSADLHHFSQYAVSW